MSQTIMVTAALPFPTSVADTTSAGFDPLAMWSAGEPIDDGNLSFGPVSTLASGAPPVWRLDLPVDSWLARQQLARAHQSLRVADSALIDAENRIDALAVQESIVDLSYGIGDQPDLDAPESELLQMLGQPAPGVEVDFGVRDWIPPDWQEAAAQIQDFCEHLQRFVAHYAWVETQVGGRLVGRTAVSWTGDMRTTWPGGVRVVGDLHRHNLHLALATRTTMLRTFAVVTTGAVTILPLLATPGGAVMALPAIWKFVNRLRSEWERHAQHTQEN